jgi:hypothetical protein
MQQAALERVTSRATGASNRWVQCAAGRRRTRAYVFAARPRMMTQLTVGACVPPDQPAIPHPLITRPDVVFPGAVAALAALDANWLDAGDSPTVLIVALAVIALVALMVAAAAYSSDPRRRPRQSAEDDSEIFTTTPLPMPKEELARMRQDARHRRMEFAPRRLPPWLQLGSVVVAIGITFIVAQRLRTDEAARAESDSAAADTRNASDRTDPDDESPESLDFSPASGPPFLFRHREWIAANSGCTGRLEVAKGAPAAWNLTARVHDNRGQLLDTAVARVGELREGEIVEFRFRRASCDDIGAWDVSGARRTP